MGKSTNYWGMAAGVVIGVCAALGIGAVAVAQGNSDTFFACEKHGSVIAGSIGINEKPTCTGGSTLVQWNEQGVPGPQGPPGDSGSSADV